MGRNQKTNNQLPGFQEIPAVNLCNALLTLTDVELIPPHKPLSEETVTITSFLTSTPIMATVKYTIRKTEDNINMNKQKYERKGTGIINK